MRKYFCAVLLLAFSPILSLRAQTDPHITSWLTSKSGQYARVWETTADKSSGNAVSTWPRSGLTNGGGGQATNAYSDVQRVAYSTNYVYIVTTGLASYTMGNWLTPNAMTYTSWPTNRAAIHRFPRIVSIPTTKQKSGGSGGVLVNGVFVWENGDAQSYSTSTATVSMAGSGIWNRLAGIAELFNFDTGNAHQPNNGVYHNHVNPIALRYQLGDNVTYNSSTKTYSEATPTRHSPIIGWANDGLPIYGPYGYATATDATSSVRRMVSGFVKRDGTNGTVNLATTGRVTLPVWAASVQGKSQTLAATEYGPTTTTSYSVGGGVTSTYSIGLFAEDYEYLGDLGKTQGVDFDLNRQNVRYCVTPEYPSGTYAYFVCISATGATVFPDIINQEYYATAALGVGTVSSITETVTEYADVGPAAAIAIAGAASGASVALSWNSAEGATYKVESSANNSTWTTLSSTVTSGGLTTNYSATTANYFRVTLTAIATYDTNGTYGTPVGKTATLTYAATTTAPSITTQPANVTVTAGASATFAVVASGTATLTYQWSKAGAAISGATSATYTIAAAQTTDAGSFTCVVTNSAGTATSNAATLTVNAATVAPTLPTQPANVTVTVGASATFAVVASGTAPFTYQWSKAGVAISGATAASYTISATQLTDAGSYTCVVTNSAGTVTSSAATLTVNAAIVAPAITTQPANVSVLAGSTATFTVVASGTAPLSYQWSKGGVAIAGASLASYSIPSAQTTDAGSFTCVVSNSAGSVTSGAATLTVTATAVAPTITTPPASLAVAAGASATFTIVASGTAPFTYQWSKAGVAIAGATAASYTISSAQTGNAGSYTCTVTNSAGSATSSAATLAVSPAVAPIITTQPASLSIVTGGTATFTVVASGTAPLSYQWSKNGAALSGATAGSYTISGAQTGDAGSFTCIVTNSAGTATSGTATLTITTTVVAPTITSQPAGASVTAGDSASFTITPSGTAPFTYQWRKDGVAISGATAASYSIASTQTSDAGSYTCVVANSAGTATSSAAALTVSAPVAPTARLINLAVRAQIGGLAGTPISGVVLGGTGAGKRVIVRAVGPTLTAFGVAGALADPQLQLLSGSSVVASNDNWLATDAAAMTSVGAFPLNSGSADAAIVTTLAPGGYTTPVSTPGNATGIVLVECYDGATADTSVRLINASARAFVGAGDAVLIPGFVISGTGTVKLLVRAVGPGLTAFGVSGAIADPQLTLYQDSTVIATNDNWSTAANAAEVASAAAASGAFSLVAGSRDAALLVTLPAGAYTANVSGVGGTTGTALVEIYVVP